MRGANILVVEDEAIVAAEIQEQLRDQGFRVNAVAKSGEEAVRLATEMPPDLVLMDVCLQGTIDGIEAAHRIHQTIGVPVVYLTAYPGVFIQDPARMQQPKLCVTKPFLASDLRTVIDAALEGGEARTRPSSEPN